MQDEGSKIIKSAHAEVAFQRSKIYRLLSYCFSYPTEELADFLNEGILTSELLVTADVYSLRIDTSEMLKEIRTHSFDLESMIDEYVRILTFKSKCPPYENEYYKTKYFVYSTDPMADIAGFYRAFGMSFEGERPDHIGAELEFMHIATLKEAEAISKRLNDEMELCISIQKKFLTDHLGRWVDAFAEALAKEDSSIYWTISLFMKQWVELECRYLNVSPEKLIDIFLEEVEDRDDENQICLGR